MMSLFQRKTSSSERPCAAAGMGMVSRRDIVGVEKGAIDANRPRSDAPRDNMTRWWSPAFNKITHSPATVEFNTINRDLLRAPGEWFARNPRSFTNTTPPPIPRA